MKVSADAKSLDALPDRHEFRWLVQPWIKEFSEGHEMRMYVLDG
jgi:hypothetical protein